MRAHEFSVKTKLQIWERANGHCEACNRKLYPGDIHYDHRIPIASGGQSILDNGTLLCRSCHGVKTANRDLPAIAKGRRVYQKHIGARSSRGFRGWRRFNGEIVSREEKG